MTQAVYGRRLFQAGAIGLLLFGAVHSLAVCKSNLHPPSDPVEADLDHRMREAKLPMGPFQPSVWGAVQILSISYSVLLLQAGALNLLVLGSMVAHGRLRSLTVWNMVFVGLLLIPTIVFSFPPPMVFSAAVLLLFFGSWLRQGRAKAPSRPPGED